MPAIRASARIAALAFAIALPAGGASAATLNLANFGDPLQFSASTSLFTGVVQRDQILQNGRLAGTDWLILDGAGTTQASGQFPWAGTGVSVTNSVSWSLALSGNVLTSTLGGATHTATVTSGVWDGFTVLLDASGRQFSTATTTLAISQANGAALSTPLTASVTNGSTSLSYVLGNTTAIASLSGTLTFSYTRTSNGNPGTALRARITGFDVTPTEVPLPAGLGLLAAGLTALGLVRRRV